MSAPRRPSPGKAPQIVHSMRALGKHDLPATIDVGGVTYRHQRTHKHDFWAVTGFYASESGQRAVLKMSRTTDFAGLPLEWIGRWLCRREMRFYQRLSDLPNVPSLLGTVGSTGFVHAYAEGKPLSKERPVPDHFFDQLTELLRQLHGRDMAYVDANKPENILVGNDGKPHLIDFQISFDLHDLGGDWWFTRYMLRKLQAEDFYHVLKHKRKLRPDLMNSHELADAERTSGLIKFHRIITTPYFRLRRRTFKRLRESGRLLPDGSK